MKYSKECAIFITMFVAVWFTMQSKYVVGQDYSLTDLSFVINPNEGFETINSGVYGPFSEYYFPSLAVKDEACHLVASDFTVICFPKKNVAGTLLAETDKTEIIQAQLFAVNNELNNRPMPEVIINIPLADMDQNFFAKDSVKRLINVNSVFDETCKLTYQVSGQSQKSEDWFCSSFLKYFDKYTGQPKLYYELHIRPVALRDGSNKKETSKANQDLFNFFKNLKNAKSLNIIVDLVHDDLSFDSILDLTSHDKWISRVLDVYFIDTPTLDTSFYDELVSNISSQYPTDNKSKPQDTTNSAQFSEKVYGPFDKTCQVSRYVEHMKNNSFYQLLYPDMFLVDCNYWRRTFEEQPPPWIIQMGIPKSAENLLNTFDFKKDAININFSQHNFEPYSLIIITDQLYYLNAITKLTYTLRKMPRDFFKSRVIQDTLHSTGRLETPCTLSYIADDKQLSKEKLKCELTYQKAYEDIIVDININYGLKKCFQREDKSCQKEALMKAVSFLRKVKEVPPKIEMIIEFEGGEIATTTLDLSSFDLSEITRLLKSIDSLN